MLLQWRQPVETQNLASHEKVSPIHTCNNQIIIIEFVAREAQDIASHTHDNHSTASAILACETQPIARHTHHNHSTASAILACETQNFASLLFGRQRNKTANHVVLLQRCQPVETQNLASHEKASTNHTCYNQTVIIAIPTREAQDIARHPHDNLSPASAILACETQNFASLLFGRQRGKRNHIYCWKNRSAAGKPVSAMTEAGIRRCR